MQCLEGSFFKARYKLSNNAIVMKLHWNNLCLKFHKPEGTFHILDLDLKHCGNNSKHLQTEETKRQSITEDFNVTCIR